MVIKEPESSSLSKLRHHLNLSTDSDVEVSIKDEQSLEDVVLSDDRDRQKRNNEEALSMATMKKATPIQKLSMFISKAKVEMDGPFGTYAQTVIDVAEKAQAGNQAKGTTHSAFMSAMATMIQNIQSDDLTEDQAIATLYQYGRAIEHGAHPDTGQDADELRASRTYWDDPDAEGAGPSVDSDTSFPLPEGKNHGDLVRTSTPLEQMFSGDAARPQRGVLPSPSSLGKVHYDARQEGGSASAAPPNNRFHNMVAGPRKEEIKNKIMSNVDEADREAVEELFDKLAPEGTTPTQDNRDAAKSIQDNYKHLFVGGAEGAWTDVAGGGEGGDVDNERVRRGDADRSASREEMAGRGEVAREFSRREGKNKFESLRDHYAGHSEIEPKDVVDHFNKYFDDNPVDGKLKDSDIKNWVNQFEGDNTDKIPRKSSQLNRNGGWKTGASKKNIQSLEGQGAADDEQGGVADDEQVEPGNMDGTNENVEIEIPDQDYKLNTKGGMKNKAKLLGLLDGEGNATESGEKFFGQILEKAKTAGDIFNSQVIREDDLDDRTGPLSTFLPSNRANFWGTAPKRGEEEAGEYNANWSNAAMNHLLAAYNHANPENKLEDTHELDDDGNLVPIDFAEPNEIPDDIGLTPSHIAGAVAAGRAGNNSELAFAHFLNMAGLLENSHLEDRATRLKTHHDQHDIDPIGKFKEADGEAADREEAEEGDEEEERRGSQGEEGDASESTDEEDIPESPEDFAARTDEGAEEETTPGQQEFDMPDVERRDPPTSTERGSEAPGATQRIVDRTGTRQPELSTSRSSEAEEPHFAIGRAEENGLLQHMVDQNPMRYRDVDHLKEQLGEMKEDEMMDMLSDAHTKKADADQKAQEATTKEMDAQKNRREEKPDEEIPERPFSRDNAIKRLADFHGVDEDELKQMYEHNDDEKIKSDLDGMRNKHINSMGQQKEKDTNERNTYDKRMANTALRAITEEDIDAIDNEDDATEKAHDLVQMLHADGQHYDEGSVRHIQRLLNKLQDKGADFDGIHSHIQDMMAQGIEIGSNEHMNKIAEEGKKVAEEKLKADGDRHARREAAKTHMDSIHDHPSWDTANVHHELNVREKVGPSGIRQRVTKTYKNTHDGQGNLQSNDHTVGHHSEHGEDWSKLGDDQYHSTAPFHPHHTEEQREAYQAIHNHRHEMHKADIEDNDAHTKHTKQVAKLHADAAKELNRADRNHEEAVQKAEDKRIADTEGHITASREEIRALKEAHDDRKQERFARERAEEQQMADDHSKVQGNLDDQHIREQSAMDGEIKKLTADGHAMNTRQAGERTALNAKHTDEIAKYQSEQAEKRQPLEEAHRKAEENVRNERASDKENLEESHSSERNSAENRLHAATRDLEDIKRNALGDYDRDDYYASDEHLRNVNNDYKAQAEKVDGLQETVDGLDEKHTTEIDNHDTETERQVPDRTNKSRYDLQDHDKKTSDHVHAMRTGHEQEHSELDDEHAGETLGHDTASNELAQKKTELDSAHEVAQENIHDRHANETKTLVSGHRNDFRREEAKHSGELNDVQAGIEEKAKASMDEADEAKSKATDIRNKHKDIVHRDYKSDLQKHNDEGDIMRSGLGEGQKERFDKHEGLMNDAREAGVSHEDLSHSGLGATGEDHEEAAGECKPPPGAVPPSDADGNPMVWRCGKGRNWVKKENFQMGANAAANGQAAVFPAHPDPNVGGGMTVSHGGNMFHVGPAEGGEGAGHEDVMGGALHDAITGHNNGDSSWLDNASDEKPAMIPLEALAKHGIHLDKIGKHPTSKAGTGNTASRVDNQKYTGAANWLKRTMGKNNEGGAARQTLAGLAGKGSAEALRQMRFARGRLAGKGYAAGKRGSDMQPSARREMARLLPDAFRSDKTRAAIRAEDNQEQKISRKKIMQTVEAAHRELKGGMPDRMLDKS